MNRTSLVILAAVSCLGTSILLKLPGTPRAYGAEGQATDMSADAPALPILPIAEAQQHLPFHVIMPSALPAGAEFKGVQLVPIVDMNEDAVIAHVRQVQTPMTGYGVIYEIENGKYMTRAWQSSPAEKAGLPSTEEVELLAVNGHKTVFDQASVARAKLPYVDSLMHSAAPLVITYRATDGTTKSVTLDLKGTFMFGAEYPPKHQGFTANLVYFLKGKEFDINELASQGEMTYPTTSMAVKVGNKQVWFSDNSLVTSATWTQGGLEIDVDNRRGALDQQELASLIIAI